MYTWRGDKSLFVLSKIVKTYLLVGSRSRDHCLVYPEYYLVPEEIVTCSPVRITFFSYKLHRVLQSMHTKQLDHSGTLKYSVAEGFVHWAEMHFDG